MEKIFSDIKKTVDGAVKKSGELVEITKLKLAIGDAKNQIDAQLRALGKIVYDASGPEYSEQEGADTLISELNESYVKLSELEARIAELKREVICPKCGNYCPDDSTYCNNCGAKFDD